MDSYFGIEQAYEALYTQKGSKFYAFAYPIQNPEEAKEILEKIKKREFKASHHCYAYVLADGLYRSSDDGEPAGTAGKPIYNVLQSKELKNILIVVARYFGGTELGVPGLIAAYKTAALNCLSEAKIVEFHIEKTLTLRYGFEHLNSIQKLIKSLNIKILSENYAEDICTVISVKRKDLPLIHNALANSYGIEITG